MTAEITYQSLAETMIPDPLHLWNNLTNPIYLSLRDHHRNLAVHSGVAWKYQSEISIFAAIPENPVRSDWEDLATLLQDGEGVVLTFPTEVTVPEDVFCAHRSELGHRFLGDWVEAQLWEENAADFPNYALRRLDVEDNPQIMELFTLSRPGPFFPRTVTMGKFFGLFHATRLIAVVGQRLFPGDFIEISGVSTHPEYQRQGLSSRLIKHVVADIKQQNKIPFLHVSAANTPAKKVYEKLRFRELRDVYFYGLTLSE